MLKKILDVVDMQNDFMLSNGKLSVPNSESIIPKANQFFRDIKKGYFDYAFVKLDTHFKGEYYDSAEHIKSKFPGHCYYATEGWKLSIDVSPLKTKTNMMYLGKNLFDMWRGKDHRVKLKFENKNEENAYSNLFKFTSDENLQNPIGDIDVFLEKNIDPRDTEVFLLGVASDYCCFDTMRGYFIRGFRVTVLEDLVKGIKKDMDFVSNKYFNREMKNGKLNFITSEEFLKSQK